MYIPKFCFFAEWKQFVYVSISHPLYSRCFRLLNIHCVGLADTVVTTLHKFHCILFLSVLAYMCTFSDCVNTPFLLPLTDIEFVKTFLYTYQSFATPDRLLRKLLERYNVVRPEGMSPQGFAVMKQTIQARVINALKLWVELSVDFKGELATTP